ncbi:hypothetical protein DPV78_000895 [Talaromyces pinophilus]|nr:hypothetical protein DPV78_000895 [Talaromyces pinophilus]
MDRDQSMRTEYIITDYSPNRGSKALLRITKVTRQDAKHEMRIVASDDINVILNTVLLCVRWYTTNHSERVRAVARKQ